MNYIVDVSLIPQSKSMSCWAAASAMLLGWKRSMSIAEYNVALEAGANCVNAFNQNLGVSSAEIVNLARTLKFETEAPKNFSTQGWHDLLKEHGPLWVGTAIFDQQYVFRHVRVVRGIQGDGSSSTELLILDPSPIGSGREYRTSVAQFALELEEIARQDIGSGATLLPQVLHC
jgi:hypothetical protein